MKDSIQLYSNKDESPGFLRGAIMWRGSVTPRILPILLLMTCYSLLVAVLDQLWLPLPHFNVTPFEYTGVVLGLVLVFRTYSVTDCSGNFINVSQNINVDDVTNPTASDPTTVSVECFSSIPAPDVTVVTDEADNCDGTPVVAWVSDDITSAVCDGATVTVIRTYSVTDCSGNSINVFQNINVDDITNPTASNPADINVECFSSIPAPDVTVVTDELDNCTGTVAVAWVSDDITSATCDGATVTVTRTYSVTDCSGNSINVYQTINVDDVSNPTASNPADINVECFSSIPAPDVTVVTDEADNCEGTVTVAWVSDDITSAVCDGATVTVIRTYSVTDCSGNFINVSQNINVDDVTNPTASNPDPITVQCFSDIPGSDISVVTDEADNCDGAPVVAYVGDDTYSSYCNGTHTVVTRTYSVTDCSGNSINVYQTITVDDNTPPTIISTDQTVCADVLPAQTYTVDGTEFDPTFDDNCGTLGTISYVLSGATTQASVVSSTLDGEVFNQGITTVTFTVYDCSGNSSTDNFDVTVNTKPTI